MRLFLIILAFLVTLPARAAEFDMAQKLLDLEGKPYRDCSKPAEDGKSCEEWTEHSLGLVLYSVLDAPPQGNPSTSIAAVMETAKRGALARRVYPGKNEQHMVSLNTSEINTIIENLGRVTIRPAEVLMILKILDPDRVKGLE